MPKRLLVVVSCRLLLAMHESKPASYKMLTTIVNLAIMKCRCHVTSKVCILTMAMIWLPQRKIHLSVKKLQRKTDRLCFLCLAYSLPYLKMLCFDVRGSNFITKKLYSGLSKYCSWPDSFPAQCNNESCGSLYKITITLFK